MFTSVFPLGMFVTESVAESVVAGVTAAREAGIDDKPVFVSVVGDEEADAEVAADVVEVAPAYDHAEITSIAAAHVAYELVTAMAVRSAP